MTVSPQTIELLLKRRSAPAADLNAPGPDAAQLETILRCATCVPDHKKLAPWRIQVLEREAIDRLQSFWLENYGGEPGKREKFERKLARHAPLLLVVSSRIVSDAAPRIALVVGRLDELLEFPDRHEISSRGHVSHGVRVWTSERAKAGSDSGKSSRQ